MSHALIDLNEGFKSFVTPFDPQAKSLADSISPKQLGYIKACARDVGADAEEESLKHFGWPLDGISKRAASMLIDHLKDGDYLPIMKG